MKRKIIIISSLLIIGIAIFTYFWVFREAPDSVSSRKAAFETEASNLINAFVEDEKAANAKFLDKVVEVTGIIESFSQDNNAKKISVTLKNAGEMAGVICEFSSDNIGTNSLKAGNKVKVKGICTGFLMDVILVKCSLE